MNRRAVMAGIGGCLLGIFAGCVSRMESISSKDEKKTKHRTYNVGKGTHLWVDNRNGTVTVEGYDGDSVEVDIEIRGPSKEALNAVSVTASQSGGELRLKTEYEDTSAADKVSVSLTIQCPMNVPVQQIQTINGAVEVTGVAGDPTLKSENGSVTARNVDGMISLSTSSGKITAREIGAIAGAKTSNGSISIDVPAITKDVKIQTANGNIEAALAPSLDAAISATTINGSVDIHDLDLSSAQTAKTSVSGVLGKGTHDLSFTVTNGSIDLRTLSG
jgi:DUF4097 and DUF4098 domain-containing protein YvlB